MVSSFLGSAGLRVAENVAMGRLYFGGRPAARCQKYVGVTQKYMGMDCVLWFQKRNFPIRASTGENVSAARARESIEVLHLLENGEEEIAGGSACATQNRIRGRRPRHMPAAQ